MAYFTSTRQVQEVKKRSSKVVYRAKFDWSVCVWGSGIFNK